MTVLLQSSDPAGRYHAIAESSKVSYSPPVHMPLFSHADLEEEAEQWRRSFLHVGKPYILCFVLFTLFCSSPYPE